jgi:hypothetical protein
LGFSERWSQDLSNGANVASWLSNFFRLHIYSLWLQEGLAPRRKEFEAEKVNWCPHPRCRLTYMRRVADTNSF